MQIQSRKRLSMFSKALNSNTKRVDSLYIYIEDRIPYIRSYDSIVPYFHVLPKNPTDIKIWAIPATIETIDNCCDARIARYRYPTMYGIRFSQTMYLTSFYLHFIFNVLFNKPQIRMYIIINSVRFSSLLRSH